MVAWETSAPGGTSGLKVSSQDLFKSSQDFGFDLTLLRLQITVSQLSSSADGN
ncbi:hypothetical protein INR49_027503 [Caranx melampygus]|nr:hypothetical protein INR49_027503 [Caranx melampygus]